jgi:hypothetical protein
MLRFRWNLVTAVIAAAAVCATAIGQDSANQGATEDRGGVEVNVQIGDAAAPGRLEQLSDFHLAAWLILENDTQVQVSQFAHEQAADKRVKKFAKNAATTHSELIAALHKQMGMAEAADGRFDTAQVLQEIAARLASTQSRSGRYTYGYRGSDLAEPAADTEQSARPEPDQQADDTQEQDDSEEQDDLARTDQQSREQRRDERQDLREQRREELRRQVGDRDRQSLAEVLPVLRDNLPAILDAVGEAIEGTEAETTGLAFLQWKQQLAERYAQSVIEELKKSPKENFDQAYLGFQVASHLRMIDTMQVAKQHASPELASTLDQNMSQLQDQLQQVRDLMHEVN